MSVVSNGSYLWEARVGRSASSIPTTMRTYAPNYNSAYAYFATFGKVIFQPRQVQDETKRMF